jgi:DNA polymerase-3 subunit gamma/tau
LFTGARGVGKTSTARIFSKALNCEKGPTPDPCDECDNCVGITAGNDIDVLEIDGASNRGIDEIRQLRSNVNVRPSRAKFKVYIIDEVHMLTKEAFNALLKTLEEPPDHVKFIFCTTDPEKIPITVLSRCQRFDFAPVEKEAIVGRLQEIVDAEGATAETAALDLLARRAAGSMRDSQSLLEQLLAFGGTSITVETVHSLLGTADSSSVANLAQALLERNAAEALAQLDQALTQGVDVGQLTEQLLGYFRDVMAAFVGASADLLRHAHPSDLPQLKAFGEQWGLETILAAVQIIDQSLARMRQSVDRRTLVETALVRVAYLEDLQSLPELVANLGSQAAGSAAPPPAKKTPTKASSGKPTAMPKPGVGVKKKESEPEVAPVLSDGANAKVQTESPSEPAPVESSPAVSPAPAEEAEPAPNVAMPQVDLSSGTAAQVWRTVCKQVDGIDGNFASNFSTVQLVSDNKMVIRFAKTINADRCRRVELHRRLEQLVEQCTGRNVRLDFEVDLAPTKKAAPKRTASQQTLIRQALSHPFVQEASELFDADVTRVLEGEPKPAKT